MKNRLITAEQVKDSLSFLERVTSLFSGNDDYKAAMLNNQMVQTQIMSEMVGVDMQDRIDPTNIDMTDMPQGLVGTAETAISSGDKGRAIFDIGGSKYEAKVTAEANIQNNEIIVISGENNKARPSDSANGALSVMVGSGEGGRNAVMGPNDINVYETTELEESNDIGSMTLNPGETKVISSTKNVRTGGYILGVGAYNEKDVKYSLVVDGEYETGGWTNSPLGSVNEPLWFSQTIGGVVKFEESVSYMAKYDEGSSGQVEITSRIITQEF